jgi:flagellar FliL protein
MADEDTDEVVKAKPPILRYVLIAFIFIFMMALSVGITAYFLGFFDAKQDEEIEKAVQQLEQEAEQARSRAEELARGPDKVSIDAPKLQRFKNSYLEIEAPLVANILNSRKVMQVKVAIMTQYDDRVIANMETHAFAVRSEMLDVLRKVSESELAKDDFRKKLAEDLKMATNSVLERYEDFGGVEEVLFTEFVVQ